MKYYAIFAPPSPENQDPKKVPEMAYQNHKFPLRAANKAITNGPETTIRAKTISCAITSKFILI